MKRVNTREFLRRINDMTEPAEVYSHQALKGTWLPSGTIYSLANLIEDLAQTPTSQPLSVGADVTASKTKKK